MDLVLLRNEQVRTSSRIIADVFEKDHKNVLRDIESLKCSAKFSRLNFEPSTYMVRGKEYPIYYITRDGFFMLVMGFTGAKADAFKEQFIDAFNTLLASKVKKTPSLIPTYQRRILSMPARDCPDNMWNVFDESNSIMLLIEKEIGSVSQYDLVDGSIGIHWAKYREGKKWAVMSHTYWHQFEDKRGNKQSRCYQDSELKYFRAWLKNVYKKEHLGKYLMTKFKGDPDMYPKVLSFLPKLLS